MKEYYSKPVAIKAIELTKENLEDVAKIIRLNGNAVEITNLDSKGEVRNDPRIITAFRGLSIHQNDGTGSWMIAKPGEMIVVGPGGIFPVDKRHFDEYHVEDRGAIDDGFHTFNELYDHRIELYIQLCKIIDKKEHGRVFRTRVHSDGSVWAGWFMLGIDREAGKQISYHLPESRWDEVDFAFDEEKAPEWDGHTPADVLERLKSL